MGGTQSNLSIEEQRAQFLRDHPVLGALAIAYQGFQIQHPDITQNVLVPLNDITVGIRDTVSATWDFTTFFFTYRYWILGGVGAYAAISLIKK